LAIGRLATQAIVFERTLEGQAELGLVPTDGSAYETNDHTMTMSRLMTRRASGRRHAKVQGQSSNKRRSGNAISNKEGDEQKSVARSSGSDRCK
jgi:hypothetical protein